MEDFRQVRTERNKLQTASDFLGAFVVFRAAKIALILHQTVTGVETVKQRTNRFSKRGEKYPLNG